MNIFRFSFFLILLSLTHSVVAESQEHHDHDDEEQLFEEHSSHVHGQATTHISNTQGMLNITTTLSSIDVFGFEHAPKNAEQKNIIIQSLTTMEKAENLFSFKNNACALKSVHIENEIIKPDTDSSQDHHDHEDEHHHDENTDAESHTDVVANYLFKCDNKKLESIEYLIFDQFPSLEEIEVQYIANDHQALFNATSSNRVQKLN